ncbi:hypothetical protein COT64_00795 [Candidatus Shapirobacteria bacterium CG09_land_8_20_14_0_10_39_12]|uniref:BioF2-like acetyltransferase domain-containing protein n=1 Tax=Candidatus Shapirobacteria bacterium CG09_land_8_20_14_0_10_39_12 TaxID=1974885 RepID=A0A2H0WS92_9BACT|nr:MAG: hypothetical protein COT64_00795 [Candidatus Shapirobacteria bacterium CG09_land_8_20_14_0_10_39_12]
MSDIRQSPEYAQYLKNIGWQVEKVGKENAFIKKFPLIGTLIKIQRIEEPIPFEEIKNLAKKHHAFQIILEPASPQNPQSPQIPHGYKPLKSPFIPTKTLILDINKPEQEIFNCFSKNKRRDIRIAEKSSLTIKEGDPQDFLSLKKRTIWKKGILPIGTNREIVPLCEAFKQKAKIILAYSQIPHIPQIPLAGLLLLFGEKTVFYWQAAATNEGKKLLAPTLLLWEAIKIAKEKGYEKFDFEGVYDERFPKNKSWLGFTHFKQGFGGKEIIYPKPITKTIFPLNIF